MSRQNLHVSGLADLQKVLNTLPAKIEANALRGALRAGAKVIADEARAQAPQVSGTLRDSIRVSMRSIRGKVQATVKAGGGKAWYASLVEFGTAQHYIKPRKRKSLFLAGLAREIVDHPGAKAHPYMRPAMDTQAQPALERVAEYLRTRLPKELKKAGR